MKVTRFDVAFVVAHRMDEQGDDVQLRTVKSMEMVCETAKNTSYENTQSVVANRDFDGILFLKWSINCARFLLPVAF